MLKAHEILGTELPIYKEKELNHFYLNEIKELNLNPEQFQIAGYVRIMANQEVFFQAVFQNRDEGSPVVYSGVNVLPFNRKGV